MFNIDGQMSIFDFIKPVSTKNYPTIIEMLEDDIKALGIDTSKSKYEIWSHVANLGKRYELFVDVPKSMDMDFTALIKKYKPLNLEVSVNYTPSFNNNDCINLFFSSMWTTKGHKELI